VPRLLTMRLSSCAKLVGRSLMATSVPGFGSAHTLTTRPCSVAGAVGSAWAQLEPRYAWAAARFVGGEFSFEDLAKSVSGDLGYTVWIERCQARLRGVEGVVPVALRVTHVYRNESGTRHMIHRHADPTVTIQETPAIVQPANEA
jgi:hypothetical protein